MLNEHEKEATANFKENNGFDGELIYGRYSGIGIVMDSYYLDEGTGHGGYEPDNPTGFRTGQCIKVQVTKGVVCSIEVYKQDEIVDRICSYGGDVGIIGKPQIGDIVGFYLGYYVQIWEKVELTHKNMPEVNMEQHEQSPEVEIAKAEQAFEPICSTTLLINMDNYKQASDAEMVNAEKALKLYRKLEDENWNFHTIIFLAGIIGFVIGYIIALLGGEYWGIEKGEPLLVLIWYYIGITTTLLFFIPRSSSPIKGAPSYYVLMGAIILSFLKLVEVSLSFVVMLLISGIPIYVVYALISVFRFFFSEGPFAWILPFGIHPAIDWYIFAVCFTASFLFLAVFDVGIPKTLSPKRLLMVIRLKKRESLSTIVLLISVLILMFDYSMFNWHFDNPFFYNIIGGIIFSLITGGLFSLAFASIQKDLVIANLHLLAKTRCLIRMNCLFETHFPLRYIYEQKDYLKHENKYMSDILVNLAEAVIIIYENREVKERQTIFKWNPYTIYIGPWVKEIWFMRMKVKSNEKFLAYTDEARKLLKEIKNKKYYDIIVDNIDKTEQLW